MRLLQLDEKSKELRRKMRQLKVFEKDIKESFVRSAGPGGQNINKVSTCVMLVHVPTGIQVKYQKHRTQSMNRSSARWLLVKKIEEQKQFIKLQEQHKREKKKRQSRKRPQALKEEILRRKRQKSEKKQSRKKINTKNLDSYL